MSETTKKPVEDARPLNQVPKITLVLDKSNGGYAIKTTLEKTNTFSMDPHSLKQREDENDVRLYCTPIFEKLDLAVSTARMTRKALHELALEWIALIDEKVYSRKLPKITVLIVGRIVGHDGKDDFGDTHYPNDAYMKHLYRNVDHSHYIVRLSKRICTTNELFIGTVMHEVCHIAARHIHGEHDQHTNCKAPHFLQEVEKMHHRFGIPPGGFINKVD